MKKSVKKSFPFKELSANARKMCEENSFIAGVILFGSTARREAKQGKSDLDLLVLWEGLDSSVSERYVKLYELATRYFPFKSLTVVDMEYRRFINPCKLTPLLLNIIWDAAVLYDKHGKLEAFLSEAKKRFIKVGLVRVKKGRFYYWKLPKPGVKVEA
ncbi:MAG: hypothetical protein DRJ98_07710 [Thermoprotei archaeon]|nr:MAG: hypothetical protein DRJ98_07710 [Thermoprotei archaeon]